MFWQLDADSPSQLSELGVAWLCLPQSELLNFSRLRVGLRTGLVGGPFVFVFERGSSQVTGGPGIQCVAKDDSELLVLLPSLPKRWDYKHAPTCLDYLVMGIEPRAL